MMPWVLGRVLATTANQPGIIPTGTMEPLRNNSVYLFTAEAQRTPRFCSLFLRPQDASANALLQDRYVKADEQPNPSSRHRHSS